MVRIAVETTVWSSDAKNIPNVVQHNLTMPRKRTEHRIDYFGAALLSSSVIPVLLLAEKGRDWGWRSTTSLSLLAISAVSCAMFLPREAHMGEDAILPLRIFRDRVFAVASAVSTLAGMVMYGGLVLMPLYLQIVRGQRPTTAGLLMTPLVGGVMLGSMTAGRLMRRIGRYKVFTVVGGAALFIGMLLASTLGIDTPMWQVMSIMVLIGIGLGLTNSMLVIAGQNSLPPQDMGLSTAGITFFRSMGGTLGAATSLALLFGTVLGNIRERLAHTPYQVLGGRINVAKLDNTTALLQHLPTPARRLVLEGFADSMSTVFAVVALIALPAFVLTFLLKDLPLRAQGGIDSQRSLETEGDLAMAETTVV